MAVSAARARKGPQRGILIDTVIDHAGKVEIFLLGWLARPGQLGELLFDRSLDIDQLGVGTVPAVQPPAFGGELGRHLPRWEFRACIPDANIGSQHQEPIEQTVLDRVALQGLKQLVRQYWCQGSSVPGNGSARSRGRPIPASGRA